MARPKKIDTSAENQEASSTYTYVGAGATPPNVINFMGLQKFVRGRATEVSNPLVLAKIIGNPSFVAGEVEAEELYDAEVEAEKKVAAQRKADLEAEAQYKKFQREQSKGLAEE